jgi:hypothetical protein
MSIMNERLEGRVRFDGHIFPRVEFALEKSAKPSVIGVCLQSPTPGCKEAC